MSVLCAHCGQPVQDVAPGNIMGEHVYHGACYGLEFPPEHPEEWPRRVGMTSHDERVRDGLEFP